MSKHTYEQNKYLLLKRILSALFLFIAFSISLTIVKDFGEMPREKAEAMMAIVIGLLFFLAWYWLGYWANEGPFIRRFLLLNRLFNKSLFQSREERLNRSKPVHQQDGIEYMRAHYDGKHSILRAWIFTNLFFVPLLIIYLDIITSITYAILPNILVTVLYALTNIIILFWYYIGLFRSIFQHIKNENKVSGYAALIFHVSLISIILISFAEPLLSH